MALRPPVPCPHCKRVLQNRMLDACQYCGQLLPPELRLSAEEKIALRRRYAERTAIEAADLGRLRAAENGGADVDLDLFALGVDAGGGGFDGGD